jgi:hypothetical protein
MFVPTAPKYKGKLQTRNEQGEKIVYSDIGNISLWEHEGKFVLRGNVQIGNEKYLVSLEVYDNGEEQ